MWPNRVWERQLNGLMASRPVTPDDWKRRREFEEQMLDYRIKRTLGPEAGEKA